MDPVLLFICKPESGSKGRGIFISQNIEQIKSNLNKIYDKKKIEMNEYIQMNQEIDIIENYNGSFSQKQKDEIQLK